MIPEGASVMDACSRTRQSTIDLDVNAKSKRGGKSTNDTPQANPRVWSYTQRRLFITQVQDGGGSREGVVALSCF